MRLKYIAMVNAKKYWRQYIKPGHGMLEVDSLQPALQADTVFVFGTGGNANSETAQWQQMCGVSHCLATNQQCSFSIKLKQSSRVTHSAAGQNSKVFGIKQQPPSVKLVAKFRYIYRFGALFYRLRLTVLTDSLFKRNA